jgi:purine-binding chemotaxis protein CheW
MNASAFLPARGDGAPLQVLTLGLQDEIFAIEARHVREILDVVPVTEVPGAHPFVAGLINVRGKVVPLADLRLKLGMELRPPTIDTRIIVVEIEIGGEPVSVGLRADRVYEIAEMTAGSLEDTPRIGMRWRSEYVRCIGKRGGEFLIVLDLEGIFAAAEARDSSSAARHPTST